MADLGRQLADLLYGAEPAEPQKTATPAEIEVLRRALGAGEAAATIGTGILGSLPAGLAGLASMMPTRGRVPDLNKAVDRIERIQNATTFMPRTEKGREYLENVGSALSVLGYPAELIGEKTLQYTGSPGLATAANVLLDPVNFIGMPGSGKAVMAAGRGAARGLDRTLSTLPTSPLAGAPLGQQGAIKMKGGNWLAGEVETAVDPLKSRGPKESDREWILEHAQNQRELGQDPSRILAGLEAIPRNEALDRWIDKKLGGYIRNEMGTPEDPVRKLAEQGILHFDPRPSRVNEANAGLYRGVTGGKEYAQSDLAKRWENLADSFIIPERVGMYQEFGSDRMFEQNPWLKKLDPNTYAFSTGSHSPSNLGFDHLIDVLREDLATGRITPEQLDKVSMEQAVRRAHQYDQEMAEKAAKATAAAREGLPVYKEYPQGYRWIELNKPGAFSAESDAMGHSVRGYEPPKGHPDWSEGSGDAGSLSYGHGGWEGIKSGDAKVYSLVDAKGAPHVTIELRANQYLPRWENVVQYLDAAREQVIKDRIENNLPPPKESELEELASSLASQMAKKDMPPEITQIKGKQNRAPKEEYLPFVQDFVRSGNWSNVRDFQNTGLFEIGGSGIPWPKGTTSEQIDSLVGGMEGSNKTPKYTVDQFFEQAKKDLGSKYVTEQQMQDWITKQIQSLPEGKARGGSVRISDNPDTMRLELAGGGGVGEKRDLSSKIAGGGIRGVITRGLLGLDAPEDMTPQERDIYENAVRFSAPAQGLSVGKAIFIGAKAKTWDKAAADLAVKMEKAGADPVDIWRKTGTFRGADGILRQEISDVGTTHRGAKELKELGEQKIAEAKELKGKLVGPKGQKDFFPKALTEARKPVREEIKRLKQEAEILNFLPEYTGHSAKYVLEHPELYKAYPELADIKVMQGGYGGPGTKAALSNLGRMEIDLYHQGLISDPRSTMLHEMQHAVQTVEDMAPGGNTAMAFKDPRAFKILQDLRKKASEPLTLEQYADQYGHYPDIEKRYKEYVKSIPTTVKAIDTQLQTQAATEYYRRLAGEAEARATQFRERMSPAQRRQEFPYSSYDVLPEDLIVKDPKRPFGMTSESASIPADAAEKLAASRAEMVLRSRAMQELKDQFDDLPFDQQPQGWMSPERVQQKIDEIRRREATPAGEQIPLLKKGGQVKFTDNLDTMRLAVQKRR